MASKRIIKRIVRSGIWALVGAGVVTLLVAANGRQQAHHCASVAISVRGSGDSYFISKSDIAGMLRHAHGAALKGLPLSSINLARLERQLEGNAWIQDAELYFDRADVLHVLVTERQPVARAFTAAGSSFYIDSSGVRLPLLGHISARVPVVTAYPAARRPAAKDSAVMEGVKTILKHIAADDFWAAQIAQIHITPTGTFELLPTVGNHIIRIGGADSLVQKLHRLMLFYQQVASQVGFDKYSAIDVQYRGQVVALHGGASAIDSVQLQKNIAALLRADQMKTAHDAAQALSDTLKRKTTDSAGVAALKQAPAADSKAPKRTAENKAPAPVKKPQAPTGQKPKAVMQKRT